MSARTRMAWVAAYAGATFLAFPHPIAGRVLDLGIGIAWLAPALFVLALEGLAPRAALRWGFLAGLIAHSAILHWIYVVTVTYGHAPAAAGVAAPVVLAAYVALFGAAFGLVHAWWRTRGGGGVFAVAVLWTALDHGRSLLFTGFPWATIGYAQHENVALLPLAQFAGVYGLSFVTALGGAALAEAWCAWKAGLRPGRAVVLALGVVVVAHGAGLVSPDPERSAASGSVRVAVAQGSIDQGVKWDQSWIERTLVTYEELTRSAVAEGARVVVWPETAVPGLVDVNPGLRQRLALLAKETGAFLVVGGVGFEQDRLGRRYYDSAYTIDPTGEFVDRYDKTHLVPFGEFVPFQELIGRFLSAMARGMATIGVTAGEAPRAVALVTPEGETLNVGIPVCYELLFPDLVRRFAADGAGVLLAMTNDAWYGRTGAPYQFLAITALRSAETGLWTARAANTGVSAFIDGRGRVRQQTPIFEPGFLVADVPLREPGTWQTFYVRWGDVFAGACWLAVLGLAASALRRGSVRDGAG